MGKNRKSAIGTLVERASRYLVLTPLGSDFTSEAVRNGVIASLQPLPGRVCRTLTWDQGAEMSEHQAIARATGLHVYFCEPGHPWQRGTNENTSGLLRQYLPKGTNLSQHTPEQLAAIATELNNRPRKCLNWDTPTERFTQLVTSTQDQRCDDG